MENGRDREGCDRWHTWPVGSKPAGATAQGVIDLAGNVLEWVQDRYNLDYTGAPEDGSAWTATGANRVTRGGGWYRTADTLRAVERDFHSPVFGHLDVGIRLCR